jgi:hypothetical protein
MTKIEGTAERLNFVPFAFANRSLTQTWVTHRRPAGTAVVSCARSRSLREREL